jgi:glycolate oxidase FAD binding subunit
VQDPFSSPSFLSSCDPAVLQSCGVRDASPLDAIEGVQPRHVAEPSRPEALAALLACASREGASIVIRGGGTKIDWGTRPKPVDLVISTRRLNRVLAHAHGDLTATVEAGITLRGMNEELARHRQWLPVDVAFDATTVGGMIATNDSGPLRHRHGTPRDLLIGVHLAMTDGRVVKAGGTVVKNVAGYDLGKLVSGSHGSLAAIVTATFKLAPLPGASTTVVAAYRDPDALAAAVSRVSASQIEPSSFDVDAIAGSKRTGPYRLLVQFASTQSAIDAQVDELRRLAAADSFELSTGPAEAEVWRGQTAAPWVATGAAAGAVVRASWLPANLRALLSLLDEIAADIGASDGPSGGASGGASVQLLGRAGVGAGLIRVDGAAAAIVAAIERLRARADVVGHVVVLRADPQVKHEVDVWGAPGDHEALLRAVKRAFDPAGILIAGRGPV